MLADKELLDSLLKFVGERLRHEVEGLLVGGNAMVYYGLRGQTKDMDLVFYKREDITGIIRIILSHPLYRGAKVSGKLPYKLKTELTKTGLPSVITAGDSPRFDLFYKNVFSLNTEEIFSEAGRSIRFDLLNLKIIEPEHLIFSKAMTDRTVDKEDILRICKSLPVNWKHLLTFIKRQHERNPRTVWFALNGFYDLNKKEKAVPDFVLKETAGLFNVEI